MGTEKIEQHLLWTSEAAEPLGVSWGFQLDWKKAADSWVNPTEHAKKMVDKFIALCRANTLVKA